MIYMLACDCRILHGFDFVIALARVDIVCS